MFFNGSPPSFQKILVLYELSDVAPLGNGVATLLGSHLGHVEEHEGEVPGEDVRGADDVPRPRGVEHQAEDQPGVGEEDAALRARGGVREDEAGVRQLEEDVLAGLPVVAPGPPGLWGRI